MSLHPPPHADYHCTFMWWRRAERRVCKNRQEALTMALFYCPRESWHVATTSWNVWQTSPLGQLRTTSSSTFITLNFSSSCGKIALTWTLQTLIEDVTVSPSSTVRNLGEILNDRLHPQRHCCCPILLISGIQSFLAKDTKKLLIQAMVISRLDYCKSLLAGLPASVSYHCSVSRMLQRTSFSIYPNSPMWPPPPWPPLASGCGQSRLSTEQHPSTSKQCSDQTSWPAERTKVD